MIHQYTGLNKKNLPAASLRELAGCWSDEDAAEFLNSIKYSEQIDEEILENEYYIDAEMIADAIHTNSSFNPIHLETMMKRDRK